MDEYENRKSHRFLGWLVSIGLVILTVYLIRNFDTIKSKFSSWTKNDEQEIVAEQPAVTAPSYKWEALQDEVDRLRDEVEQLKQEVQKLKNSKPVSSPKQTQTATVLEVTQAEQFQSALNNEQEFNSNALTVVSFVQDWVDQDAHLSIKNNTDKGITSFKATVVYKSMNDDVLDYEEINQKIDIAPQMAKSIKIKGYGHDMDYAYYKSEIKITQPDRKFKIEFVLNSYK